MPCCAVLRTGVAVGCVMLETEWECVMRAAGRGAESWVGRGLLHVSDSRQGLEFHC